MRVLFLFPRSCVGTIRGMPVLHRGFLFPRSCVGTSACLLVPTLPRGNGHRVFSHIIQYVPTQERGNKIDGAAACFFPRARAGAWEQDRWRRCVLFPLFPRRSVGTRSNSPYSLLPTPNSTPPSGASTEHTENTRGLPGKEGRVHLRYGIVQASLLIASATAMAIMSTISLTSEPRCRTCTALLMPRRMGPMGFAPPMRLSNL